MTVKKRISLLVIAAGLITSLLFSIVVFLESIEQPFKILDQLLKDEAYSIIQTFRKQNNKFVTEASNHEQISDYSYWMKICEQGKTKILYRSDMVKLINLPLIKPGSRKTASIRIPRSIINLHQDKNQEVTFRIRTFLIHEDGKNYIIQVARPMERLQEGILRIISGIGAGLLLSCMFLIFISNYIAGKILKPISDMKELTENINEKNLSIRIPTGSEPDEFNELARTINTMLDRLQNSFIKQRSFLFDTSHELKTPLTTMRLSIDDLCSSDTENLSSSTSETLYRLNDQVLRMERLVKELLNLSYLETITNVDVEPIDLTKLLLSLIQEYNFIAEAEKIKIDVHIAEKIMIQGNIQGLTRVFSNLFDNAIKYNTINGRIEVISTISENDFTLKIGNTGPGVNSFEVDKVFDQFFRAEKSRSVQHGGYGLGLAIVKRIIELHKGIIKFESRPGVWTQVIIVLPVSL